MVEFYADPTLQKHHSHAFQTAPRPAQDSVLPPGLDKDAFEGVLRKLRNIVGEENVAAGADLINFRDPYPLVVDENQASAAVW